MMKEIDVVYGSYFPTKDNQQWLVNIEIQLMNDVY